MHLRVNAVTTASAAAVAVAVAPTGRGQGRLLRGQATSLGIRFISTDPRLLRYTPLSTPPTSLFSSRFFLFFLFLFPRFVLTYRDQKFAGLVFNRYKSCPRSYRVTFHYVKSSNEIISRNRRSNTSERANDLTSRRQRPAASESDPASSRNR